MKTHICHREIPAPERMTADARFDRIVDAAIHFADKGSVDGTFSYRTPERPSARFAVRLDGVAYYVTIAPQQP